MRQREVLVGISNGITPNTYFLSRAVRQHKYDSYVLDGLKGQIAYEGSEESNLHWIYNDIKFSNGCIVSIILDLSKAEMRLEINNEDKGIVFQNIKKQKNMKYRLVVSMYCAETSVRIMNFKSG